MNLGKRMLRNIKENPMMFKQLAAAGMKFANAEKEGARITGKDYTNKSGKGMDLPTYKRVMKFLDYDYGES